MKYKMFLFPHKSDLTLTKFIKYASRQNWFIKSTMRKYHGPFRLPLKPACSASFFIRNSVFLSQHFIQNSVFHPISSGIPPAERGQYGENTRQRIGCREQSPYVRPHHQGQLSGIWNKQKCPTCTHVGLWPMIKVASSSMRDEQVTHPRLWTCGRPS